MPDAGAGDRLHIGYLPAARPAEPPVLTISGEEYWRVRLRVLCIARCGAACVSLELAAVTETSLLASEASIAYSRNSMQRRDAQLTRCP